MNEKYKPPIHSSENAESPEALAQKLSINWGLTPDEMTRLAFNLEHLFQSKNSPVWGIVQQGNVLLGKAGIESKRSGLYFTPFKVTKKTSLPKDAKVNGPLDLATQFYLEEDDEHNKPINETLETGFTEEEELRFKEELSKRVINVIWDAMK